MSEAIGIGADGRQKCAWCLGTTIYEAYHDDEWGVPIRDDKDLFAKLMLDGFQAGLSWSTILNKRDNFDRAFDGWDPEKHRRLHPGRYRPAAWPIPASCATS